MPGPGHRRAARLAPPRLLGSSSYARASVGRSNRRTSAPSAASCLSGNHRQRHLPPSKKGKSSPYSITERRVPELIPVLGSLSAGDMSHKPDGRLPLLSARPAVTPETLRGLLPILLLGEQRHNGCEQFAKDCYPTASRLRFEPWALLRLSPAR